VIDIPDTGEHTIRYYGWYSNKSRGMRAKLLCRSEEMSASPNIPFAATDDEEDTPFRKLCRSRWAAMIKKVYETDPLKCPNCGGQMKIVAFIERKDQPDVIEKILRHCGLWTETKERSPPVEPETVPFERIYVPMDEFLANF
jgi:hypothetical protein